MNVDSNACSSGLFTFNKPEKNKSSDTGKKLSRERTQDSRTVATSKTVSKFSNYEKMDEGDDDDSDVIDREGRNLDQSSKSETVSKKAAKRPADMDMDECSGSLKQKLDINDGSEDCEMKEKSDSKIGFKCRKLNRQKFRSRHQKDSDEEEDL